MHTPFLPLLATLLLLPDYPKAVDDHVNDFAEVLDEASAARIKEVARAVRSDTGVPIVLVTVGSLADFNAETWSVERYATNLYNEWGIGSSEANKGILLLVAVKDRKVRITAGQGFGTTFDSSARSILDSAILPRFKKGDYEGGIVAGVESIAAALRAGPGAGPSHGGEGEGWTPRGTPVGAPVRGGKGSPVGWVVLAGLGVLVLLALRSVFRGGLGGAGGVGAPRPGFGGWGGLLMGGLGGFLGSALYDSVRRKGSSGHTFGGGGSGGGSWGGGSSSFGGGFSSGGGASGSW